MNPMINASQRSNSNQSLTAHTFSTSPTLLEISTSKKVTRQSLGYEAKLGSLYNIRKDQFCGNEQIFFDLSLRRHVSTINKSQTRFNIDCNDTYVRKLCNLNIEAPLILSILCGWSNATKEFETYLTNVKEDNRTVKATIICRTELKYERLNITPRTLVEYISTNAFDNPEATHVVTEIQWGANILAVFERKLNKQENQEEIEENLKTSLLRKLDNFEAKIIHEDLFSITYYGNIGIVLPKDQLPRTVSDTIRLFKIISQCPQYIDEEKAKPIAYRLFPLKELAILINSKSDIKNKLTIKDSTGEISCQCQLEIQRLFDEHLLVEQELLSIQHMIDHFPAYDFDSISKRIDDITSGLIKFQTEMRDTCEKVRNSLINEIQIERILRRYERGVCSFSGLELFINENKTVLKKLHLLRNIEEKGIQSLASKNFLEDILHEYRGDDIYTLYVSIEQLLKDCPVSKEQYQYFLELMEEPDETKPRRFFLVDYDIQRDLTKIPLPPTIHFYCNATLITNDYFMHRQDIPADIDEVTAFTQDLSSNHIPPLIVYIRQLEKMSVVFVDLKATIHDLINQICNEYELNSTEFYLTLNDIPLDNSETLDSTNIHAETNIELRMKSGSETK
ncbi:unnamed protein product [Didymodactylos carnosus]|uniref:Ubiquitin-like domain-containing protein n=1 Tax=Didymodactylos carnosus TaxID=1234261 RepID=A0A8S2EXN7_9BILA|nr:unnamed protein product [Didymodactylos carnosus]CAF4073518.1 unnamed protein product [Didymodactylos carnosus]